MTDAARWLHSRLTGAPPALLEAMLAALPERVDQPVPEALAEGAMSLLAQVRNGSGGREDALPLLAADALFTHALEAQAELDPDGLPAFAERIGAAGAIGALVRTTTG